MSPVNATPVFDSANAHGGRPETRYSKNAVFHVPARSQAFDFDLPPVPVHRFDAEREQAFAAATATGVIALDLSVELQTAYRATTPTLLAAYLVLRGGDTLDAGFAGAAEIYYVIEGRGITRKGGDSIEWQSGDVFRVSGGEPSIHHAAGDALLYACCDEPALAFSGTRPCGAGLPPVHYLAEQLAAQTGLVQGRSADTPTWPVQLTVAELKATHAISPLITAGINVLEPGGMQRPHRHNAAAITLAIQGEGFSMIGGLRVDWQPYSVIVTPPGLVHSHHNVGTPYMLNFTVQDAGLHFYARTMDMRNA